MAIWPFGRRRDADEPTPEPAAADSASPATGEADVARPARVPTGDWMTVPPVRTSMAPAMPTTFRVQTLPEILTSHQDTRLSTSLGHAVSSEAPSGVIGGLASATRSLGAVSHEGTGGAPSVLHEPAHPARPEPAPAPPLQRRLTASTEAPLAVTSPETMGSVAPPAPALPEPAVSRVLASRGPVPSPTSLGANPLPVARVVDTAPAAPRSSSPTSSAPSPAPDAPSPAPSAPETGAPADDRVGGFEVDLTSLLGGTGVDDDLPVIAPPADLAPPIQRSVRRDAPPPTLRAPVQRAADRTAPAPSTTPSITPAAASPDNPLASAPVPPATPEAPAPPAGPPTESSVSSTGDLPPIQRLATPGSPPAPPAGPAGPAGDRPTVGGDALGGVTEAPLSSAGTAAIAPPAVGPDLTLAAPPVQRAAETDAGPGGHFPGDGHDHGDDEGAVQRAADPAVGPPTSSMTDSTTAVDPEAPTTAPVAGEDPLTPVSAGAGLRDTTESTDAADSPEPEARPLVSRSTEPAAPTLGADGAGDSGLLPLQTLSDTVQTRTDGGASSLPLAPPEQPGTLIPRPGPTAPPSAASTGLIGDGPRPTVSGAGAPALARPVATQRSAESGVSPARAGSSPLAGGTGPLVVAPRPVAPSSGGTTPAAAGPALRPLASSAGSLLLASPAAAGSPSGAGPAPMTVLGAPPAEAPAVPLQRSFDDDGFASTAFAAPSRNAEGGRASSGSDALPLARSASPASGTSGGTTPATSTTPLVAQRAVDGGAGPAAPTPMPLHTAAAAVPSTTDILVKAGLGEKGPDGSFLRSTPPPGTESSFTVQTMPEATAPSTPTAVQRAVTFNEVSATPTSSGSGSGGDGSGGGSEADVRKLYLKLRAELEADLRRQLEAKSRYNRYRP